MIDFVTRQTLKSVAILLCALLGAGVLVQIALWQDIESPWGEENVFSMLGGIVRGEAVWPADARPVTAVTASRLWASAKVMILVLVFVLGAGVPAGVLLARLAGFRMGWLAALLPALLIWTPAFWLSVIAYGWLIDAWGMPASGAATLDAALSSKRDVIVDRLWHLLLPALTIAIPGISRLALAIRNAAVLAERSPYVGSARARGVGEGSLFYRYVLRNSLRPTAAVFGYLWPYMLGSLVLVEWVFNYPGLGSMIIEAGRARDLAGLLAANMTIAVLVLAGRLVSDLIRGFADPRLRA